MSGGKGGSPTGYTTTTQQASSAPWSVQQPYLQQAFQGAQNLYQGPGPQFYPQSTVAPVQASQWQGLNDIAQAALGLGGQPTSNALSAFNYLTGGQLFNNNPAVAPLTGLSGTNLGLNNPGTSTLENIAQGVPGLSTAQNLATSSIAPAETALASGLAPVFGALGQYASGSQTNPFLDKLSQSTMAAVEPSLAAQFVGGGGLQGPNNPQAMYSISQGVGAALAPVLSNAFQQEQQNQLAAAGMMGNLGISGANALQNLMLNPAQMYGNLALGGAGLQSAAAQGLGSQALQGGNLQTSQLGDIGSLYNAANQQRLQGLQLYPSVEQGALLPGQTLYGTGLTQQNLVQQQMQDAINRWNYGQTLPYQQLRTYLGNIGGNYGGMSTGTTSSPYYTNRGANILSDIMGAGLGSNMLFGGAPGAGGGLFGSLGVAPELTGDALGGTFSSGAAGSGILGTIGPLIGKAALAG